MGLLLVLLAPIAAAAPTHPAAGRTALLPLITAPAPSSTTVALAPPSDHRLLHPDGPEPGAWDGDWPELDLDLSPAPSSAAPTLPPSLSVRLCWCAEVQHSARALPGVGMGAAWRTAADTD